ncbi:accessory Sec system protein Asp3 [Limosilactobacillus caecicola]|uniref:accessory Sec system protein Asp3 n=1 Tax=Limosilactobacillus caecicola TaxID=2941332 RepID=UPI00203A5368|nr:accessory Sec system protein Asp3 [Limosilactobacillus caecicola]
MKKSTTINHIYWIDNNILTNGTHLKLHRDQSVDFHNLLMTPGKPIIVWDSVYNYQGSKMVPQLPLLKVNYHYRIVVGITSVPDQTYLIRLIFRDLQGTELKRKDFRSPVSDFVFPAGTASYSIEIINAGFTDVHFDRIDICEANLPKDVNNDVVVYPQANADYPAQGNYILVKEGKQSRRYDPEAVQHLTKMPMQVISISWQNRQNVVDLVSELAEQQGADQLHLVSSDPSLDETVITLLQKYPGSKGLIASSAQAAPVEGCEAWPFEVPSWYSPDVMAPNWSQIGKTINHEWRK